MGQTLYVEVRRSSPLSDVERSALDAVIGEFDVADGIERFGTDPEALNWESFLYAGDPEAGFSRWCLDPVQDGRLRQLLSNGGANRRMGAQYPGVHRQACSDQGSLDWRNPAACVRWPRDQSDSCG